jgi:hypothetical protein
MLKKPASFVLASFRQRTARVRLGPSLAAALLTNFLSILQVIRKAFQVFGDSLLKT